MTLVAQGGAVEDSDFAGVQRIFECLGAVVRLQRDEEIDTLSVVTSCMPGLLAAMLDEFARTYELDQQQARELLIETALGSLALARRDPAGLRGLVSSVCNQGGLTEVGVSTIREKFPAVFSELRQALERKQAQRRESYLASG